MLLTLLMLMPLQDAAGPADGAQAGRAEQPLELAPLGLYPAGIEAPEQPQGSSSASYERTPRFEPVAGRGSSSAVSARVSSLVDVRGQEENQVMGIGLVTGLAGTGDSVDMTKQLVANMLLTHNISIDLDDLRPENAALVRVEASLPPGIKPGGKLDARISAIGDAVSLVGGTLTMTELTDISGSVVYATASGSVSVGGFFAEGTGASATKNHPTVGTLAGGAKVQREVPTQIVSDHGYIYLDARAAHSAFGNLVKISDAINSIYPGASEPTPDGRTVKVRVPKDLPASAHVAYLDSLLKREIVPDDVARVIIDERTGTIVMGQGVRLRAGAIAHGDLTVTIAETPEASQPGAFSRGQTEVLPRTDLQVVEENNGLAYVPAAATLQEVVEVLNVLGTTPRDTISILQAMAQGGLLLAEIRSM